MVLIIFQPPFIVPAAIVKAQATITKSGISKSPVGLLCKTPPAKSANVIIPIVFWASLEPWLNAIMPADKSCNFLNLLLTVPGWAFKIIKIHAIKSIRVKPTQNPNIGEVNIGIITLSINVWTWTTLTPALTIAAPSKPPIRAWEELDGNPKSHVSKFQITAESKAQKITVNVIMSALTIPEPIVFATCVPVKAPINSRLAPKRTACLGDKTFVDTTVAIALAQSWNPFINSNTSAINTTAAKINRVIILSFTIVLTQH